MGVHDSSRTRVAPVFKALSARSDDWLGRLLSLPQYGHPEALSWSITDLHPEEVLFGSNEKALEPPVSLLHWLLENAQDVTGEGLKPLSPETREKRQQLLARNPEVIDEGRRLLSAGRTSKAWHVLEGPSYPDVFIRTRELIVVIEGKRTEAGPTTSTTWLSVRHQMLRHLDGALEIAGNRAVVGFFIVEGDETGDVPAIWRAAAAETISPAVLDASLPHRSPAERTILARGFLGVTSWQTLCATIGVEPGQLPEWN